MFDLLARLFIGRFTRCLLLLLFFCFVSSSIKCVAVVLVVVVVVMFSLSIEHVVLAGVKSDKTTIQPEATVKDKKTQKKAVGI